jgi:class 3 adenylate cyclase
MRSLTTNLLVSDLAGSTALLTRVGHDRFRQLTSAHLDALSAIVVQHGGRVFKTTGDGLMATVPSATEALRATAAMHQEVEQASRRPGAERLRIRIGVAVGDVDEDDDGDVHGLPVVEAVRLCAAAGSSQTLCSDLVARIAASRGTTSLVPAGTRELKGFPGSQPVHEVPWALAAPPLPARLLAPEREQPFVGRAAELSELSRHAREVRGGTARVVLLCGEAGIGKTRLATELARRLQPEGVRVLYGRADPTGGAPLEPFGQALAGLLETMDEAPFRAALGPHAEVLQRLIAPVASAAPHVPADKERLFDAVVALLGHASLEMPVLVLLDDVQWAGADCPDLLHHLARHPDLGAVLVVATVMTGTSLDDTVVRPLLGRLRREPAAVRIDVGGLDAEDVARLVSDAGRHPGRVRPTLVRYVSERTGGNALYVCELVRQHLEAEAAGRDAADRVPDSVQELVAARVGVLDDQAEGALSVAAVIGDHFDLATLAALDGRSVDDLAEVVHEAVRAGLVAEVHDRIDHYHFVLPIVRDVLAERVPRGRRARLHRRIAEAIEAPGDQSPAIVSALAYHWGEAGSVGDPQRALTYALRAGANAADMGAFGEALEHHRRARRLLEEGDWPQEWRYEVERGLADALTGLGDAAAARAHYRQAAGAARQLGDSRRLGDVALAIGAGFNPFGDLSPDPEKAALLEECLEGQAGPAQRSRLLVALANALAPEDQRRVPLADEAVALARGTGDDLLLARVLSERQALLSDPEQALDRLATARGIVEIGVRQADRRTELLGQGWLAVVGLELGDPDVLRAAAARREELSTELAEPVYRWTAAMHRSLAASFEGDLEQAEQLALAAVSRGIRVVGADAARFVGAQLLQLRRLQGRTAELLPTQRAFVDANPDYVSAAYALVSNLTDAGRIDDARELLDRQPPIESLRRNYDWFGLTWVALSGCRLGRPEAARRAAELLEPYRGRMYGAADAVLFHGVSHAVAVAKQRLGDHDADAWFDVALGEYERLGAAPWLALLARDWDRDAIETPTG